MDGNRLAGPWTTPSQSAYCAPRATATVRIGALMEHALARLLALNLERSAAG